MALEANEKSYWQQQADEFDEIIEKFKEKRASMEKQQKEAEDYWAEADIEVYEEEIDFISFQAGDQASKVLKSDLGPLLRQELHDALDRWIDQCKDNSLQRCDG